MDKKIVFIVGFLMTLMLVSNVLAITAKIGNGIMILKAETGDVVEKSILVINDNDVAVNIELTADGELAKGITIKDKSFTLQPGEEKKAYFTIKANEESVTESRINVKFTPVGEKSGAVLSSKITFVAIGETVADDTKDSENQANSNSASGSVTGKVIAGDLEKKYIVALIITGITVVVFIVVIIIYYKTEKKAIESEKKQEVRIVKTKLKKSVKKRA